jgi:hypothetical protein
VRGAPSIDTFILNSILLECLPVYIFHHRSIFL